MKQIKNSVLLCMMLVLLSSCAVISRQIRDEAMAPMPFKTLAQNAEQYKGKTVILGGYILGVQNKAGETLISVLETPLSPMESPYGKDRSEGRFIVRHQGFLDPEVYTKGRRITVAGTISGLETQQIGTCPYACLTIDSREIYLWPRETNRDYYYDPYYYPYDYYPYYPYPYFGEFHSFREYGYTPAPFYGGGHYGGGHEEHEEHEGHER